MILQSLKLKNFRVHRDAEFTFKKGVNGIIGKNGSGKSSIIEAIQFLFTGKLDDGSKEEAITVGQASGYVSGEFEINGKHGSLQRWLDSSKVHLEYDGKKYVKSSEVNELWNQLFQIDANIFSNVIIAHQKEIPLLFSGDEAEREKLFQKIFMVPNTTRLRTIIWDQYIKSAPPEYPVESDAEIADFSNQMIDCNSTINKLEAEMIDAEEIKVDLKQAYERIAFLEKCVKDEGMLCSLRSQIKDKSDLFFQFELELAQLLPTIEAFDYKVYSDYLNAMSSSKALMQHKDSLLTQLYACLETDISDERFEALNQELLSLKKELPKCEACGQALLHVHHDTSAYDAKLMEIQKLQNVKSCALNLKQQINSFPEVSYNEEDFKIISQAIEVYLMKKEQATLISREMVQIENDIKLLDSQIANIAVFDHPFEYQTPQLELESRRSNIELYDMWQASIANKQTELALTKGRLTDLSKRIENAKVIKAKNEKRNSYIKNLQQVYDLFHTNQFPRKLISSYTKEVEDELIKCLSKFNLPYNVEVDENFKVNVINSEGLLLPKVSGGQEMIIGLCLRFALHNMFSQSFSLLIIDEGTTHLDAEENKPLYFEMLKTIKRESNISQIIIIDHDQGLHQVVDHVIQL